MPPVIFSGNRVPLPHLRGRIPIRPFLLPADGLGPGPVEAFTANRNGIFVRTASRQHVVKPARRRIDHDRSGGVVMRKTDDGRGLRRDNGPRTALLVTSLRDGGRLSGGATVPDHTGIRRRKGSRSSDARRSPKASSAHGNHCAAAGESQATRAATAHEVRMRKPPCTRRRSAGTCRPLAARHSREQPYSVMGRTPRRRSTTMTSLPRERAMLSASAA